MVQAMSALNHLRDFGNSVGSFRRTSFNGDAHEPTTVRSPPEVIRFGVQRSSCSNGGLQFGAGGGNDRSDIAQSSYSLALILPTE